MAALFVWVFVTDKTKNSALIAEIKEMVGALKTSNENIAKSLELLQSGCNDLDKKIDRNYEKLVEHKEN